MKDILIIAALAFAFESCSPNANANAEERRPRIAGVVQSIRLSSGKHQSFIISIKDLKGAESEFSTMEISYNVGDTIDVVLQ